MQGWGLPGRFSSLRLIRHSMSALNFASNYIGPAYVVTGAFQSVQKPLQG